jgi:nicotinamide mononucleotide transporter
MDFFMAHWHDIVTTVLGLAYILLEYRASLWMWVVGFAMQALGIVLYYQKGLYADCGMEFYYLSMTVYGYWKWVRGNQRDRSFDTSADSSDPQPPNLGGLKITHIPLRLLVRWSVIMTAVWALIYWLLVTYTNSNVPLADSFTTALSLIGIWALAHKYLEQWFIWIAVDVVTSILYFYKDIPFKASLYALYVIIAIFGYMKWRRMMTSDAK